MGGAKMAEDHRRSAEELLQGVLLDEPEFLRQIVERVLQEMLEAQMTEHVGAAPYERTHKRTGQRNGYKPRALRTRVGALNLSVPQDLKKAPSAPGSFRATRGTRRRLFWRSWRCTWRESPPGRLRT
jgi:transposase-like protein